jgi:DNA-binding transcriptional MerR regulator
MPTSRMMKMTTNNPKSESYIQELTTQTEFEISLEDKFLEEEIKEIIEAENVVDKVDLKSEASSLPSVLIDEKLLEELASIPDRFGFKIGDVADLLGIKQYVLRYWEEEFEILKPKKASNNQRLYTKKDVENAFLIRKLLYRDKFSIEGARQALKDVKFQLKKDKEFSKDFTQAIQRIEFAQTQIKNFVEEIKKTKKFFN